MKKKFLIFILSICFIIPCMFMFSACSTTTPVDIEFKVENGYIQYYDGSNWNNLIAVEDLKGDDGADGDDGEDADVWTIGNDGYWYKNGIPTNKKAVGQDGEEGNGISSITKDTSNSTKGKSIYIIELDDGTKYSFEVTNGIDGEDLNREKYTVIFDYKNPLESISEDIKDYANNAVDTLELSHGSWCGDSFPNYEGTLFAESFKGWFIEGTDVEIKKYDNIGGDITLVAKWENVNMEAENCSYASSLWVTDGCVFNIDLTQENVIVPDYYKTTRGLKKVRAVRRIQEHTTGTEYALETIKLPAFLTKFWQEREANPDGIFEGCVNLKEIEIPETVATLGKNAFDNCKSLESIKLPSSMTTLQSYTFYQCTNLKSVELPAGLTTIEGGAFAECESLRIVNIPEGVTMIGSQAFRTCTNLKTVYLPKSLETIQSSLNVENLYYNGTIEDWLHLNIVESLFGEKGTSLFVLNEYDELYEVTELNIPDSIEEIQENAFRGFNKLTKLIISDSVKSIGDYAFGECRNLIYADLGNGVETIGDCAISTCTRLETLVVPTSVKNIGEAAFGLNGTLINNSKLCYKGNMESWNSITKGDYYNLMAAFDVLYYSETTPTDGKMYWHYYSNMPTPWETATFTSGTTIIKSDDFSNNHYLKEIHIPTSVSTIEENAIAGCSALETVVITKYTITIDSYAFYMSDNIKNVFYYGTEEEWNNIEVVEHFGTTSILLPEPATIYYFSSSEPTEEGNYWHYDTDGKTPVAW